MTKRFLSYISESASEGEGGRPPRKIEWKKVSATFLWRHRSFWNLEACNFFHLFVRHHKGEDNDDCDKSEDGEDDPGEVADDPPLLPPGEWGLDYHLASSRPTVYSRGVQTQLRIRLKTKQKNIQF